MQALTPSLWYWCSSAPDVPAPTSSVTNPLQQSARDGMSRGLFPHRPLLDVTGAHGQATTIRFFVEWADIFLLLLRLHDQPRRGVRTATPRDLECPLLLTRRGCPQSLLPPRSFSFSFKMPSFQRRCLRYPSPPLQAQPPAVFRFPCPPVTRTCLCRVPCHHT